MTMHWMSLRLLLAAAVMISSTVSPATAADFSLPDIGDSAGVYISPTQERRLGQAFMRSVRASSKVVDDPLLEDYIRRLGRKLAGTSDAKGQSFDFFLVKDPTINAFAGPGGHIGVHTGLILAAETESELAAVVAHEIAHVSQRHIARMIEAANTMSVPSAAVLLAAVLLGAAAGGDAAMAAAVGGQAALLQQQINFTRANEQEADRIGMQILSKSSFDPRAMPVFFQRMGRADRTSGITLPEFLRTHPVSTSRIADSLGRAEAYPYRQAPESLQYHLLRATLRVDRPANPKTAVEQFQSTLRDGRYRNREAEEYGHSLALMKAGNIREARSRTDALLKKSPREPSYIILSARLHKKEGSNTRALQVLRNGLKKLPNNYPVSVVTADILMTSGKASEAHALLKKLVSREPGDPRIRQLSARAAASLGKKAESHEQLAEYHYLNGELDAAIQQLEIANRLSGLGFYERS
ncbi:MAG: M48 family metalloprotease, partial [Pseudomonadota bacterium]